MIPTRALGLICPITLIISHTIEIFVLNRSSRVIPGLRGIPAGIITTSVSATASYKNYNQLWDTCRKMLQVFYLWLRLGFGWHKFKTDN